MPGIMPKITKKMSEELEVPVIVGGLISDKDEIDNALKSGALGVSTSAKELWR
jgi:glycerol uptake operon antiterminator